MTELLTGLLDVVRIAHDLGFPHQEQPMQESGGGGASGIVILAGVAVTLMAVAGLVWLKKRSETGSAPDTTEEGT
ncbi:MAG TPA: hypothetical protein VD790_07960 [Thermoleophilaceae bacterium]|nr:hypothetical protein [Thermoleophilaceae bacterium]